jgi:hypothetical protein
MKHKILIPLVLNMMMGCSGVTEKWIVTVKNEVSPKEETAMVTIPLNEISTKSETQFTGLLVKDTETGECALTQVVDQDGNGVGDALIFLASVPSRSVKKYELIQAHKEGIHPDTLAAAFSRFVPERIDDYAWENDRVAFRTYGPEAERLTREKLPGGTLSSGIDCWLKRVSYPVINKWYRMDREGKGSYHTDHGEGLDNYHVGSSRGCGGIGIRKGDTLFVSANFINYRTLENGPLRTTFELEYAPWDAAGMTVKEKKRISLDMGSNLSKVEVEFASPYPEEIVAGLAIPGKEGKGGLVTADEKAGWFSFWSEHDGSELGIGLVAAHEYVTGYTEYRVSEAEKSHLFVHLKTVEGKVTFFTGFGWKKSGQFGNREAWESYLQEFAVFLSHPLQITIDKP